MNRTFEEPRVVDRSVSPIIIQENQTHEPAAEVASERPAVHTRRIVNVSDIPEQ